MNGSSPPGTLVRRDGRWLLRLPHNCCEVDLISLYDRCEADGIWEEVRRQIPLMSGSEYLAAYRTEVDAVVVAAGGRPRHYAALARMAKVVSEPHSHYEWLRHAQSYVETSGYRIARPEVYPRCPCAKAEDNEPAPDCGCCDGTGFKSTEQS